MRKAGTGNPQFAALSAVGSGIRVRVLHSQPSITPPRSDCCFPSPPSTAGSEPGLDPVPSPPQPQVLSQVWILSSLVVDSLAISGQTLVAVQLGKGDPAAAREVTDRLLQV